jgi:pimeloyl-ACP methyl ester carboxylesterase
MVHGAGGGGWEWAIWQRVFAAQGWNATAPDLRPVAHGLRATRIEDYVDQVVGWTRAASNNAASENPGAKPVLIGASLGGLLALLAVARVAAAALVLINPLAPRALGSTPIEPRPAWQEYPDIVPWSSRRSLASTLRAMPDADDAARLFALRRWRDESGAVLRAAMQGVQVEFVRCPVLVVASEQNADVEPAASRALAAACAAEFRLLPGMSHVGPLLGRNAARVAHQVLTWCVELSSEPGTG